MNNQKWLKRKYPNHFDEVMKFLDEKYLENFKTKKLNLGRLKEDCGTYHKAGDLILFKRSNPVNNHNYPMHHAIGKCPDKVTSSGYHSFGVYNVEFEEITK